MGIKYGSAAIREIFNSDEKDEFENYVDGHSESKLVDRYSTVIHELLHGYNKSENGGYHYFVEPGIRLFVKEGKYYSSKELNRYLRKGQQDSIFRYGLYVGGELVPLGKSGFGGTKGQLAQEGFSVSHGIYGLLEEYNAYYYGALSTFELYPYYSGLKNGNNPDGLENYKQEIQSDIMAHFEFNLFFAWYLSFAKTKHPDVYEDIMNNNALRVLYTLLDDKFSALSDAVDVQIGSINKQIKPDMMEILDFSGSEEDLFLFIELAGMEPSEIYKEESKTVNGRVVLVKKSVMGKEEYAQLKAAYIDTVKSVKAATGDGFNFFFAQHSRYVNYLKKQYTTEMQTELNKLRIPGVTTHNFKEFLK